MGEQQITLWLKCKASSGQFANERAISGEDFSGRGFSLFVESDFIAGSGDSALLQVVKLASEGERVLVQLPGETFENGQTITVRRSQLADAPAMQEVCS